MREQECRFRSLASGFVSSSRRFPGRPALAAGGREWSYEALAALAAAYARAVKEAAGAGEPMVALLARRSETAYGGILGIIAAGKGYVPLNPRFPAERLKSTFLRSGARLVVAGREALERLAELLPLVESPLVVITPGAEEAERLARAFPVHGFVPVGERSGVALEEPEGLGPESPAYLLFTSGSTGEPKGVAVSHGNVTSYVRYVAELYQVSEEDRLSQHFDLTFDLSVHDMFVAWERGACVCCVPESALLAPARFIREQELTMWFSVPSLVGFLMRLRLLEPGAFPALRWSLFCGEALPAEFAEAWQRAAPNSAVENLYGPTEATIAITRYRWESATSPAACRRGIVPIGRPFEGQEVCVVDSGLRALPPGESGELALGGSQVTGTYWNDPARSAERFVVLPERGAGKWYLTGDLACEDADGCLHYLGRLDEQVKVRGYRVELQEIDHAVRTVAGTQEAVAVAWPLRDGSAGGVVAFISSAERREESGIIAQLRRILPDYMVPARVHFVNSLPSNANGKIDRKQLVRLLESGGS
jgi:amino acid adenylation domain-containing protein